MTKYTKHFNPSKTPQTEKAREDQVLNNAGGYVFALDKWKRLERFLVLGSEGNTYYQKAKDLTKENAKCFLECLKEDPERAVGMIKEYSVSGRAPKNDPMIFCLALAVSDENEKTRTLALGVVNDVCRTGTHLFQFVSSVDGMRGWGRALRRAVGKWYTTKSVKDLTYQVTKYQQREGWSHKDVLRLAHTEPTQEAAPVFRYIVSGTDTGSREVKGKGLRKGRSYPAVSELPPVIQAIEELKKTDNEQRAIELIREFRLTREMIPNQWFKSADVWEAMLQDMPITATIRNLAKMTQVGLLKPLGSATDLVVKRITDPNTIKKGRVHPIQFLSALNTYSAGKGEKGSLTWTPVRQVVDALDDGFYKAFDAIEPTNKRIMLALDVSGSMGCGTIAGVPGLTPRAASAAMAMVTARTENNWFCVGFTGYGSVTELKISPKQRLDDVVRTVSGLPFGTTDCALPMLLATQKDLDVDSFLVYTDSETYQGNIHAHQALKNYRNKTGINSKLVVVGLTATSFTIADPNDPGSLDVAGFDSAAPNIIADFCRE